MMALPWPLLSLKPSPLAALAQNLGHFTPSAIRPAVLTRRCTEGSETCFCSWPKEFTVHTRPEAALGLCVSSGQPRAGLEPWRSPPRWRLVACIYKASTKTETGISAVLPALPWRGSLWWAAPLGLTPSAQEVTQGTQILVAWPFASLPVLPILTVTLLAATCLARWEEEGEPPHFEGVKCDGTALTSQAL